MRSLGGCSALLLLLRSHREAKLGTEETNLVVEMRFVGGGKKMV